MAGRVAGKVAFITGAARGQGRSHAVRLAEEGADVIAADLCDQVASVGYPLATPQDLDETARQVAALGRRSSPSRRTCRCRSTPVTPSSSGPREAEHMAGRAEGKVAFITGAARGQGRSHAVRLAEEGADIIAVDIAEDIDSVRRFYPGATEADLAETVKQVEALDRSIVATKADVRDYDALKQALDDGVAQLGHVDIVSANAAIWIFGDLAHEVTEGDWQDLIDVNLTGVWHTAKAAIPHLIAQGTGGSIIITSSTAGLKGTPYSVQYVTSKHAVIGLMRTLAMELAPHSIRVNTVNPTGVDTIMIQNEATWKLFLPDVEHPTREQAAEVFTPTNALPVPWVEPRDVSNAVLFLASDEARYITGTTLLVDAGYTLK